MSERALAMTAPRSGGAVIGRALRSSGVPLSASSRALAERRLGRDLSEVRIHEGEPARQATAAVGARAFTVGREIVFGGAGLGADTASARELLAHELVHVAQQSAAPVTDPDRVCLGEPGDRFEREASALSCAASATNAGPARVTPSAVTLRRWSYAELKSHAYDWMIAGLRAARQTDVALLRAGARRAPAAIQTILGEIISVLDGVMEVLDTVVLAIIGMIVGFGEGVVGMIHGLVTLALGALRAIWALVRDIWNEDGFSRSAEFWSGVASGLMGLPHALRASYDAWMAEFQHATPDRAGLMVAELFGQLLALIASFAVGGVTRAGGVAGGAGDASTVARVAEAGSIGRPAEVAAVAARPAEVTAAATRPAEVAAVATRSAQAASAIDPEIDAAVERAFTELEPVEVRGVSRPRVGAGTESRSVPVRRPPRLDIQDIQLRPGETARQGLVRVRQVIHQRIADTPLADAWRVAREQVLAGRDMSSLTHAERISAYSRAQQRFWQEVRASPNAVEWLDSHGFSLDANGAARLRTTRGLPVEQVRVSLDHVVEKSADSLRALDAENLQLEFHDANSMREIVQMRHPELRPSP